MATSLEDTQQELENFIKTRSCKKSRIPDTVRYSIAELSKEFSCDELAEALPISKSVIHRIVNQHNKKTLSPKKIVSLRKSTTVTPIINPPEFISVPLKNFSESKKQCRMEIELEGHIKVRIY